jgi:c-di-GMP-binding flagellar brake protein YcgR
VNGRVLGWLALRGAVKRSGPAVDEIFRPGLQVRIDWFDRSQVHFSYRTIVEDVLPTGLVLQAPTERGSVVRLAPGTELTLWAALNEDAHVAMVRVIELRPGNPPLLSVTRPWQIERTSRRRYYRVNTRIEVDGNGWHGVILDLSASGCLLWIPEDERSGYQDEAKVSFALALPSLPEPTPVSGRVVRKTEVNGGLRLAIEFTHMTRRVEDRIMRYVLERERQMVALGLLRQSP